MPMDRAAYPTDWEAIARARKDAAGWRCESCDRPCRQPGEDKIDYFDRVKRDPHFSFTLSTQLLHEILDHPQRFTLTVSHHPDPDPMNVGPDNLRALCAPCHCRLDAPRKAERRRQKEPIR